MYVKAAAVTLILMLTGVAQAQEFCIQPLNGAEPQQPTGFLTHPNIIPGYGGIVFTDYYRKKLLHYNGSELLEIKDDFPHLSGFAHTNTHIAPNGDAYGFGSKPKGIFYLPKGEEGWRRLDEANGYRKKYLFDKGNGDVLFWREGKWKRIHNGKLINDFDPPVDDYKLISRVQTVPELNGTFALLKPKSSINEHKRSLWFKPKGGAWIQIDIPDKTTLEFLQNLDISVRGKLIHIRDGRRKKLIFLTVAKNGLKFLGAAPEAGWTDYDESGDLLAWVGKSEQKMEKQRFFGLLKPKQELSPPKLSIIRGGSATQEVLSQVEPRQTEPKGTVFFFTGIYSDPSNGRSFVYTSTGLGVYDGKTFLVPEALSESNIGKGSLKFLNGETYIQSKKGVFKLTKALTVERVDTFPIPEPWGHQVEIEYLRAADLYLVSDSKSKSFYTSSDMESFTEVGSEYKLDRISAVLNQPPAAIVSGEDGLYNFAQNCQAAK